MAGRKTKAAAAVTSPANVGVKRTTASRTSVPAPAKPSKVTKKPAKKVATTKAAAAKVAKAAAKPAPKKTAKKPVPKKSKVTSKPASEEDAEMENEEDVETAESDKEETPGKFILDSINTILGTRLTFIHSTTKTCCQQKKKSNSRIGILARCKEA